MTTSILTSLANRRSSLEQKADDEKQKGFTLVELLVVVLIIGVLAAIAIPLFLAQREKAWEAQVTSDIGNARIAIETIALDNDGSYKVITTGTSLLELTKAGYTASASVNLTALGSTDGKTYIITAKHTEYKTQVWTYTSSDGKTEKKPLTP